MKSRGQIKLKIGDYVPAVTLPSTANRKVSLLAETKDNILVLFFFPGYGIGKRYAELSGCTLEGQLFRDNNKKLQELGVKTFGVSLQTTSEQKQFVQNEKLNFELLSDKDQNLTKALGVTLWISPIGEEFTDRTTFIIDKGGRITNILENVKNEGHIEEITKFIKKISSVQ